jgi:ubiquinone biosynthesis protein UbiJ
MFSDQRQFFSSRFGQFANSAFSKDQVFSFALQGLKRLEEKVAQVRPPEWLVHEVTGRAILLLNHILLKEPQAMERIKRQKGRTIEVRWQHLSCRVQCTAAGLLELSQAWPIQSPAVPMKAPDLSIELMEKSMISLLQMIAASEKPPLHIQGDVQLAAEVNWLVDHVRWDLEDDLAKLVGDVNAHQLGRLAGYLKESMAKFVSRANESFNRSKDTQRAREGSVQ